MAEYYSNITQYKLCSRDSFTDIFKKVFCTLNIRYMFTLSVIHPFLIRQSPLVDHSLSATCPLNMRYSCVL